MIYKKYVVPNPMLNNHELDELDKLTKQYQKMIEPNLFDRIEKGAYDLLPDFMKTAGEDIKNAITAQKLYISAMEIIGKGFGLLEEQAAKMTLSPETIVQDINKLDEYNVITSLNEVCLVRSYKVAENADKNKFIDFGFAFFEGGICGAFGFAGLPFNLVLSTFFYYRAVQSIAMLYGYDVQNNADELAYAGQVFIQSLSQGKDTSAGEVSSVIGKIMMVGKVGVVKNTAKKGWTAMAEKGGVELLLAQMRALANKAAKKAIEKAGQKGLEQSIFRDVFEQIGKKITLESIGKAVPIIGAGIGALFDLGQMKSIIEFSDMFYHKRFILEKETRIGYLHDGDNVIFC